jgi:hypothetical protein
MTENVSQRYVGPAVTRAISVWGLLVLLILLLIVFSVLKPETFPTFFNFKSILNNKSVQALVALAVFIPMTANHFDLSAGFNLGISQVLAIGLQGQGLPWWAAVVAVLLMGALVGFVNGVLVTRIKIDSFIATLGTGTVLYGLNAWYTGGQQVLADLPAPFLAISGSIGPIPAPAVYTLIVSLGLWVVFEYLPLGRYLYVLGAKPARCGIERHLRQTLRSLGIRRRGNARRVRRDRASIATPDWAEFCRPGISAASLYRRASWRHLGSAWSRQCLGNRPGCFRSCGDGGGAKSTWSAVLRRAAVQWLHAYSCCRSRRASFAAANATR